MQKEVMVALISLAGTIGGGKNKGPQPSGGGPGARRSGSIYAFKVKQGVYRAGEGDRFV